MDGSDGKLTNVSTGLGIPPVVVVCSDVAGWLVFSFEDITFECVICACVVVSGREYVVNGNFFAPPSALFFAAFVDSGGNGFTMFLPTGVEVDAGGIRCVHCACTRMWYCSFICAPLLAAIVDTVGVKGFTVRPGSVEVAAFVIMCVLVLVC